MAGLMKTDDDSAAAKMVLKWGYGIAKRDIEIYFWKPLSSEMTTAHSLIENYDNAYVDFGLIDIPAYGYGFHDSSAIQQDIRNALGSFRDLGIISSYSEVTSPMNSSGGLVDMPIGITLLPTTTGSDGKITKTLGSTAWGYETGPHEDAGTEAPVFFDSGYTNWSASLKKWVVDHELLHGMGLDHPHDVGLQGTKYDSFKYSIMSYEFHPDLKGVHAQSLMMLDYLALQQKGALTKSYGAESNSSYAWSDSNGPVLRTIYDTGGDDDYISAVGHSKASIIDLRDGHFSSYGVGVSGGTALENLAIFWGSIIEDAIGSDKDDVIIGNAKGNNIKGGKGDDFLYGNGLNYETDNWNFSKAHKDAYAATVDTVNNNVDDKDTIYGGDGNDYIDGQSGDDTLYGDDGHDFIFGGFGDDFIEGGKGSDHIYGGDGKFSVVEGNDTIDGGEGNDILEGGAGKDKYIFTGTFGRDIIKDSDNSGSIVINGTTLSALTQSAKDSIIYYDNVNNPTKKAVVIDEGNTKSLVISTVTKTGAGIIESGNSVTIKNWAGSGLGLSLSDAAAVTTPNNTVINGTSAANKIFSMAWVVHDDRNGSGNDPDRINTTFSANGYYRSVAGTINSGAGNDYIVGSKYDDIIDGGADNDILDGAGGKDTINGGDGNDFIAGFADGSTWHGGTGKDMLLANSDFVLNLVAGAVGENYAAQPKRDLSWQDVSPFVTFDYKTRESTDTGSSSYSYSAWIGIAPGTYKGVANYGTNLTFELTVKGNPFPVNETPGKGVFLYRHDPAGVGDESTSWQLSYYDSAHNLIRDDINQNLVTVSISQTAHSDTPTVYLYGDEGDDLLVGSDNKDELYGGDDNDYLMANGGDDLLDGGKGSDTLGGGWGNDLLIGGTGNDALVGDELGAAGGDDQLYGGEGHDTLSGNGGADYLDGGTGADKLYGGDGKDYLYGGDDNEQDLLFGDAGNDILVAGATQDYLDGGADDDIYILDTHQVLTVESPILINSTSNSSTTSSAFIAPGGNHQNANAVVINDTQGNNTIALAGVSSFADVAIESSGENLTLFFENGQQLSVVGGATRSMNIISTGAVTDAASVAAMVATSTVAVSDDNFLNGTDLLAQSQLNTAGLMLGNLQNVATLSAVTASTYLVGGLVNDNLSAHSGGTRFVGGRGDDTFNGNVGNDIYLIRKGDGNDIINEKGGTNTIKLDKNISEQSLVTPLSIRHDGADLVIKVSDEQSIAVKNMFNATTGAVISANSIQNILFYDNTNWDLSNIKQLALVSTAGDDVIGGFETADTLKGSKGNDQLSGNAGNDVYQYALGDGNDTVIDSAGSDRIEFTAGVLQNQVTAFRDGYNNLILRLSNGEKITVAKAFDSSGNFTSNAIETIKFSDNSSWDSARIKQETINYTGQNISGTTSNDNLIGDDGKDIITGGKGNDTITGNAGDDIYRYALGDGNDVITDVSGLDQIEFGTGITQEQTIAKSNGKDLILTLNDGGTITVKDMFVQKSQTSVDPHITSIIQNLQSNWMKQAETLIENNYGLVGSGDITLNFVRDVVGGEEATVSYTTSSNSNIASGLTLSINLEAFATLGNGTGSIYYDRIIAHEMVHAVMARNMNMSLLPGWFTEGAAELIHGADYRVNKDLGLITSQDNVNALFKTTVGSPADSASYSVSYIAVKLLDKEIRVNGGAGIKDLFAELKTGKTLNQSLADLSASLGGMSGLWNNLASFEAHFKTVGFASMDSLLNINNADTGSIAGSDYGNLPLDPYGVLPNNTTGPSQHFNLVIPEQYTNTVGIFNTVETIQFADGIWNVARINQEIAKVHTIGTTLNDVIDGTAGNDIFIGYKGDDQLNGGSGDDIYHYALGDGNDVIVDTAGVDQIQLGAGINSSQLKVKRDSLNNLVLTFSDGGNITVANAFDAFGNFTTNAIEKITFTDTSWGLDRIKTEALKVDGKILNGTVDNDSLLGDAGNDTLSGNGGSDSLWGGAGNDILDGGSGSDYLYGGNGADTYLFGKGYGYDQIVNNWEDNDVLGVNEDTILLDRSVTIDNILLSRIQDDLFIKIDGRRDDTLRVINYFLNNASTGNAIEWIKFSDDTLWDINKVKQKVLVPTASYNELRGYESNDSILGLSGEDTIYGNGGNDLLIGGAEVDYLYGGDGNDTLDGGTGRDLLSGGAGIDVYRFGVGYGLDTIDFSDYSATNSEQKIIELGKGITPSNVVIKNSRMSPDGSQSIYFYLKESAISYGGSPRGLIQDGLEMINVPDNLVIKFFNNTLWNINTLKTLALTSTTDADEIFGDAANNIINGGGGNDSLYGMSGNDTLNGGTGNDYLTGVESYYSGGDSNADTYQFNVGSGQDSIEARNDDTISFGSGITPPQVSFVRNINDLVLKLNNAGDSVTIINGFYFNECLPGIVKFSDGTIWNIATLANKILSAAQPADLTLTGNSGSELLTGGLANDTINGGGGADTLDGGAGNDLLNGGSGNDVYLFGKNSGHDIISSLDYTSNKSDVIQLDTGISTTDVRLSRFDANLVITVGDSLATLQVKNLFLNDATSGYRIDKIKFADTTVWDVNFIKNAVLQSSDKDDRIYGYATNDTISGGLGNDVIDGGLGSDTFIFNRGDGHDEINGGIESGTNKIDVLQFGNTILPSDISFKLQTSASGLAIGLELFISETNDSISIPGNFFSADSSSRAIDLIKFANGDSWTFDDIRVKAGIGTDANDKLFTGLSDVLMGLGGNDYLYTEGNSSSLYGGNGDDRLETLGSALLDGGAGMDFLLSEAGHAGESIYIGGLGDDEINGGAGNDTYRFSLGDGFDKVYDRSGLDTLELGAGIVKSDLIFTQEFGAVAITFKNSPYDKLLFSEWTLSNKDSYGKIETIKFFDGSTLNIDGDLFNDTTPPSQPTAYFDVTGKIVSGNAEAGSTVSIKNVSGTEIGSGTATSSGTYSITLGTALTNKQVVNVTAKDSAGNISSAVSATAPLISSDTTAPNQPTAAFDSAGKVVSGSAEAGSTVSIKNTSSVEIGSGTATSSGTYSITLVTALINKETVIVTAKDAAGNVSVARSITAPDLTAPSQPTASFDSTGKIVSGNAEAGSIVSIKNASAVEIGSGTATSSGTYSVTLGTALTNKQVVSVTAKDSAGNISSAVSATAPLISSDTTAPNQPTAVFDSTGKVVSGSAEAGSTVSIKNASAVEIGTGTATSAGSYSITLGTALLNSEAVNVTAKDAAGNVSVAKLIYAPDKTAPSQPTASFNSAGTIISGVAEASSRVYLKDAAGNAIGDVKAGSSTGAYQFTLTTALVNKEVISASAKDAAGNYSVLTYVTAPDLTAPSQPTAIFDSTGKIVSGSAEAGATVSIKNTSAVEIGSGTATSSGTYSITLGTALTNKQVVSVTAKDAAGNISSAVSATAPLISSDTTAPNQPTAAFDSAGKVVSGSAEAGSTVSIKNASSVEIGSGTATSSGTYSITLGTALINKQTVSVTAKDSAGNVSVARSITAPDLTAPSQPTASFDSTGKIVSGSAEAGSTVSIKNASAVEIGSGTVASSGTYSITLSTA
ncbi:MAG: hypothetical protein EOO52_10140, partial [Gammaproteobacteria bacterium]